MKKIMNRFYPVKPELDLKGKIQVWKDRLATPYFLAV